VAPTKGAHALVRPLGTEHVQIEGGYWGDRQRINREETLLAGHHQLERTGSLDNLRIAAGLSEGTFRGLVFVDSDVYKWLEAVSWELGREPSAELERLANDTIDLIATAQQDDGYLNSYYQLVAPDRRFTEPQMGHELYCAGHLIQAAVAHARITRTTTLLGVAVRFADLLDGLFGEGGRPYLEGHPEIEMALVELYRVTGEDRYLKLACHFIDQRGHGLVGQVSFGSAYLQDHEPVREASTVTGHAVRQLYLNAGVTDAYLETGDDTLLAAQLRQWDDMVSKKLYLTGGVGSRHRDEAFGDPYELPPDRAYTETCAAISSVMWSWRLLLVTGESRYADLIERTLYNGFASGLSLDGRSYYYTNPLQMRSDHETQSSQGSGTAAEREPWYPCACCPPNIMRLISSLGHYLATVDDDGVQLHQYVAATLRTAGSGGPAVTLQVRTEFPWAGSVEVSVEECGDEPWTLSLRWPAWSQETRVTVNGSDAMAEPDQRGYLRIRRAWRSGDRVDLELEMNERVTAAHPRVDAVRGCVAIERGPLVYAFEQADLPADVVLEDVYLSADPQLRADHRPDLLGGVTTVTAKAVLRRPGSRPLYARADNDASADAEPDAENQIEVTAIPYYAWANRGADAMRVWVPLA
jgi:DUF1680 family protein